MNKNLSFYCMNLCKSIESEFSTPEDIFAKYDLMYSSAFDAAIEVSEPGRQWIGENPNLS